MNTTKQLGSTVTNTTMEVAKHQQTVVVGLAFVGTVVILPIGIWTLLAAHKAKIRPIKTVSSLFCLTVVFYLAFQALWNQVLNNC